jgi:hypothetical protein
MARSRTPFGNQATQLSARGRDDRPRDHLRDAPRADRSRSRQSRAGSASAESAQIATVELPRLSATARQLSARWQEQSLLDRKGAEEVLAELESELKHLEPKIDSLLDRQREIAALLRSMLDS